VDPDPDKRDEIFFGSKDTTVRPALNMSQIKKAKLICQTCPVIAECLAFALSNRENYGVWGGTTGRTRQKIWAGIEAGAFTFAKVIDDYSNWNIRHYEKYKPAVEIEAVEDEL
jgi:Transcription factor WhiB